MYLGHDPESSSNLIPEKFHTPQGLNVLKLIGWREILLHPPLHLWSNRDTINRIYRISIINLGEGRGGNNPKINIPKIITQHT